MPNLDPTFRYVPSIRTDVAATFRRVRAEIEAGLRLPDGTPHQLLPAQRAVQARLDAERFQPISTKRRTP